MLQKLCKELVDALDISTPAAVRCVPAAMQALSSIGRLAPEIFAEHAASVADFVLEVSLFHQHYCPIKDPLLSAPSSNTEGCLSAGHETASGLPPDGEQ